MTTPDRFQALDERLAALLPVAGSIEKHLDQRLEQLFPGLGITARTLYFDTDNLLTLVGLHLFDGGTFQLPAGSRPGHAKHQALSLPIGFSAQIDSFCRTLRQDLHARLAADWQERDSKGLTRVVRLASLRSDQFEAEMRLRSTDQTLSSEHIRLLRTCLELPLPWQRRHLPLQSRPQLYRPLLTATQPNWRSHLPGFIVLTEHGPEGQTLDQHADVGRALLCSVAHGVEAFDNLAELHKELCERLEDPQQSEHLLGLLNNPEHKQRARQAEQLRYDWYTEELVQFQAFAIRDAQLARLTQAWHDSWKQGLQRNIQQLDKALADALDMRNQVGSTGPLATRYGLLLENHLPNWLRTTSQQGVTHIMQALQQQVAAIEGAAAPGILTLEQFNQKNSLLNWVRERLREYLQRDPGLDIDPRDVFISVTVARQVGPLINPSSTGSATGYIPAASRPIVGDTVEFVGHTYRLDELALLNIAWFEVDYWLTAKVHLDGGEAIPALTPSRVKQVVRRLNAGTSYQAYLRTQLLDSPEGQWRQLAHAQLNRSRMNADAVKGRYAGHFLVDTLEQGYGWASTVINAPDSHNRPYFNEEQRVDVQQLLIQEHTLQGVLVLVSPLNSRRIVIYTPDAPDRRYWREYANARGLIRAVRGDERLRNYVLERLPLANPKSLETLLVKGRLGSHIRQQTITGNLYDAVYRAEVNSLMAETNAATRSNEELLGTFSINVLRLLLDIITLVLPQRQLIALAFGRMGISIWDGFEAFHEDDHEGALHHAVAALSHATEGLNTLAGSGMMRRVLRGMPKPPPVPLPSRYEARPPEAKLRYRIDGAHGEAVYEQTSASSGLSLYYVRDGQGRYFNVSFDGTRWRATDPKLPLAYLKLPIKRRLDGAWVVDSPLLWYDGLPDLKQLLAACHPLMPLTGSAVAGEPEVFEAEGALFLQLGKQQVNVRHHPLAGHYHLAIPEHMQTSVPIWAVLRLQDAQWHIRVRQPGRSSDWLALPADYSASLGSSRSNR
ncbi:dermonecrotic toxin domain-containing protein [Pseudomonas sp. NPDC089407]|uniref:dermonecrotic toxin domain-containing protein n=1 Tax=Pseudomonas sp. NPDC089407 TaxID=3364464 RepID=UPI003850F206